jgi:hypothetical protein
VRAGPIALAAALAGCNSIYGRTVTLAPEPCAAPLPPCAVTAQPVVGDWDGDDRDTPGLFDQGRWCITNRREAGDVCVGFRWGAAGDTPIVGDWNGDGGSSPGWFNATRWSLKDADRDGNPADFGWGVRTMQPVAGDWDGRGRDTPGGAQDAGDGVAWSLSNHNSGGGVDHMFGWGAAGTIRLVGDWDGNGTDTPAWYRNGTWTFSNVNSGGGVAATFQWGGPDDTPLVGDWDGDGFDTVGLYRNGAWSLSDLHIAVLSGTQGPAEVSTFRWGTP